MNKNIHLNLEYILYEDILQSGSYGNVKICLSMFTYKQYACKKFYKDKSKYAHHEYDMLKKCNHENIIKVRDLLLFNNRLYMIMELCEIDLHEFIDNNITNTQIKNFSLDICNGLNYLHNTLNMIHRDIKLENILIKKNRAKICDFNFAMYYNKNIRTSYEVSGTPDYMCPEILIIGNKRKMYGPEIDIWGFGVILYTMITDEFPFNLHKKSIITKHDYKRNKINNIDYERIIEQCFNYHRLDVVKIIREIEKLNIKSRPRLFSIFKHNRKRSEIKGYNTI